ncbi:uncharacterized protein [Coffea arabica]|uniref:Uncharacterized protein isoform X2 n=1 Tax=Coffea arabica TaxID=13443 RepID=A0ABM4UQ90_COFAR
MALAASFTLACPSLSLSSRTRISSSGSCYPLRCSIQNSSLSVSVPDTTISKCNETLSAIQNSGIIACLRAESAELAFEAARAALNGGITVLEIVMSNPGVFEVLQQLVHEYPTKIIGVGTVLNLEDAKHAMSHGAKFLLSPAMGILDDVSCSKALYIPGAMTPTEILSAFSSGAKMIKVLQHKGSRRLTISEKDYVKFLKCQTANHVFFSSASLAQQGKVMACFLISSNSDSWVIDSGATDHMSGTSRHFCNIQESISFPHVTLTDGSTTRVKGKGLEINPSLPLSSVLYIPNLSFNIMYVSKLTKFL